MNDLRKPCETRLEAISLLAAGCLADQEERELNEHLAECPGCRGRFAELASLGSSLRAAKPVVDVDLVRNLAGTLPHAPSPASTARQNRLADSRVALLALSVLMLVGVLSYFALRPTDHVERPVVVVQESPQLVSEDSGTPLPTLLALRRAAAESDESFDRLLARYSGALVPEPIHLQSLSQESVQ
jgi:anti-sigma factor RsiW